MKQVLLSMICMAVLAGMIAGCDSGEYMDQTPSNMSTPPSEQSASAPAPISEADLEKAASASLAIDRINERLQQDVQATEDATERMELQIETNKKMVQAAEEAGLDYGTYNNIMQAVQTNPMLEDLFEQKRQQQQ